LYGIFIAHFKDSEVVDLLLASLRNEVDALRLLRHDHIVTLVDIVDTDSHLYIVTELLGGVLCKDNGQDTPYYSVLDMQVCDFTQR
jgi:serine/threonine protein kinase